jgi:hypothetical protein
VVEGLSYPPRGAQVVRSQFFEFHSCVVIVDPSRKRIWIFNPWRIGDRPRILNRVKDIQSCTTSRCNVQKALHCVLSWRKSVQQL